MASLSATSLLITLTLISITLPCSASIIADLNTTQPPPDFNTTISNNCARNPSLRYCDDNPSANLLEIFKSTIVTNYLCKESNNPSCPNSFEKIDLKNRHNLAPLYLSFTFFWKYCPLTITSIDLSNTSLTGSFPSDILHCSQIQYLDLSLNGLTGEFPLESFTQLSNLTFLNLSFNNFLESEISGNPFFKRFNSSSFLYSGLLRNDREYHINAIVLLLGFPVCIILLVGCLGFFCFYRPDYLPSFFRPRHRFTQAMLKAATNGFSDENLVCKIGKLEIYRGIFRDGTEVRIEICRGKISRHDYKKYVEECKVLVQLNHKNLVQVLGWCDHRGHKAIITEWRNGVTLEIWLSSHSPLWRHRLKVLRKILEGMLYLQEQWPEIGFDVNASSVLLAENGEPLISKFKVGDGNSNKKRLKHGEASLIEWTRLEYKENIWKVVDDRLKKAGMVHEQADKGIRLAFMCIDIPTEHHFSLAQVYDIITRFYEFSLDSRSPNRRIHKN
ncbi:hypothetical protein ACHQM5_004256 [Ranunculus cassubicifolius]